MTILIRALKMFLYSALQPTRTGRALETRPWVKIRKSRASSNLEKIRPDPKKGGSVLLGYLNTRKCDNKKHFPTHFLLLAQTDTVALHLSSSCMPFPRALSMLRSCDVLSFERAGHVLRLQPAMNPTTYPWYHFPWAQKV